MSATVSVDPTAGNKNEELDPNNVGNNGKSAAVNIEKTTPCNVTGKVSDLDKECNITAINSVTNRTKRKRRKKNKIGQASVEGREDDDVQDSKRLKIESDDSKTGLQIQVVHPQAASESNISGVNKKQKKKKQKNNKRKNNKSISLNGELNMEGSKEPGSNTFTETHVSDKQCNITTSNSVLTGAKKKKKQQQKTSRQVPVDLQAAAESDISGVNKKKRERKRKKKNCVSVPLNKESNVDSNNEPTNNLGATTKPAEVSTEKTASCDTTEQDLSADIKCNISASNLVTFLTEKRKRKKRNKINLANGKDRVENYNQDSKRLKTKNVDSKSDKRMQVVCTQAAGEHLKNASEGQIKYNISPKLNSLYSNKACKDEITKKWKQGSNLNKDNGFEVLSEPFKCTYMPSFFQDAKFLYKVKEELSGINFIMKNNDLYKFHQTSDLRSISSPYISSLREYLYGDFRKWLSDATGIELNETVDMGSSRYGYTDVLLCHDDELEGRRIAYILYLVPEWSSEDGGTLDLFNSDENGQPKDIVKSFLPSWNDFAYFEVSPVSFHQVNEVLSKDKVRLSINGWFHGPNIKRPPKYVELPKPLLLPVHIEQDELYSWINPSYLDMDTQKSIRKRFQKDSEIELESFLSVEKYEELISALHKSQLKWFKTGPANKQSCMVLDQENLPEIISSCCKFLQSEALFLTLSQLTGLKLHHLAPPDSDPDSDEENDKKDSNPGMVMSIRKWNHGCYKLIRDGDQESCSKALDAMLFLHVANCWKVEHGGFTTYIAKDEDEELLTVVPRSNCFALVYRDLESVRFTKYVNAGVKDLGEQDSFFYDISCSYFE